MLLPNRNTIRPLLEEQKFQSAKEGIALAGKVDALRREFNELKKNRDEFIAGTILEIEKATRDKTNTLNTLQGQIEALEAKRKELAKPLNAAWQEVKQKDEQLQQYANDLASVRLDLDLQKEYFKKDKKEFLKRGKAITLKEQQIAQLYEETKGEKIQAKQILKDAIENRDEIEKECAERLIKVSELENKVEFARQANDNEKKSFIKKEQDLARREKILKDREEMYSRKLKRDAS